MNSDSTPNRINNSTITKSTFLAYFFLIFFGGFGIHRFYLGQVGSGIILLLLNILGWITFPFGIFLWCIMLIWLIIDLFILHGSVDAVNNKTKS